MKYDKSKNTAGSSDEAHKLREKILSLEEDIGNLRKVNAALIESEDKYRTIFETTGTATIVIENDKIISMVNTEFENLSGYTRDEIEGKQVWTDFIDESDIKRMKEYHKKRRNTPDLVPRNYECLLKDKYGDYKTAILTVALIPGTRQSVASVRDITERRKAEEALKSSEEKFSKAFKSSPQAMMISTLDEGRVVDVNDTLLDITGYNKKTIVGLTQEEFHLYEGMGYKDFVKDISCSGRIKNKDVIFRTTEGEIRYGYLSAEIINLQGTPCMLTSISDISEQRRLEAEILKISEAERRKIGHDLHDDLGQHLVGVEALSILLKQRLENEEHPETYRAEEIFLLIREATKKTRNLAKGLCPVNMDEGGLVSSIIEFSKHIENVFSVSCQFKCDQPLKIGNNRIATNLYHIVQEAVNNALRHGKANRLCIVLTLEEETVMLTITDNGCGIGEIENKSGLGLRIMEYRAKSIGAHLEITANKEKGTRVTCTINQEFLL
ncbi:MAG: PAS domain S-box protein [Desulfobacterales bacterium]|nr:PAS domain S-box protein [Desulfobacterales bacterium]